MLYEGFIIVSHFKFINYLNPTPMQIQYIFCVVSFLFTCSLSAQLPTNGLNFLNLLDCKNGLHGPIEKIVQTKLYHSGVREKARYFFGSNNQLQKVSDSNGGEIEYFYDENGNIHVQLIREYGEVVDSLVGIYSDDNHLRGLMTYRGGNRNLVSVQQVMYNHKNQPERIKLDEVLYSFETNSATHHSTWQELKWKNENEFSVDQVRFNKKTKYIVKNVNAATLDAESGCLLVQNDGKRTINNLQGEKTVEIFQVEDDPNADKVLVEYEYDEQGNWIWQRHFAIKDGERARKKQRLLDIKRKIQYKEQNPKPETQN